MNDLPLDGRVLHAFGCREAVLEREALCSWQLRELVVSCKARGGLC